MKVSGHKSTYTQDLMIASNDIILFYVTAQRNNSAGRDQIFIRAHEKVFEKIVNSLSKSSLIHSNGKREFYMEPSFDYIQPLITTRHLMDYQKAHIT